jgi:hypothetical protein
MALCRVSGLRPVLQHGCSGPARWTLRTLPAAPRRGEGAERIKWVPASPAVNGGPESPTANKSHEWPSDDYGAGTHQIWLIMRVQVLVNCPSAAQLSKCGVTVQVRRRAGGSRLNLPSVAGASG